MKKKAIFSLYNTERVEEFAGSLIKLGWEIIASKETVSILRKKNMPVINIADFTGVREDYGFPPTLHPKIEAGLTSKEGARVDLVYVIPYPLAVGNDVGGRTILALAAKGERIPVMSVADMQEVIVALQKQGRIPEGFHRYLLNKANALIANHYDDLLKERGRYDFIAGEFRYDLLNGENPYQVPAQLFSAKGEDALALGNFKRISGEAPCFTNLADSDAIIQTMCLAARAFKLRYKKIPKICIAAKHGNPCGMGVSWNSSEEAVKKALFGNPRSVWGGELIVNFAIGEKEAELLYKSSEREEMLGNPNWMLDVVLAPSFSEKAKGILGKRKERKLLENKALLLPVLPPAKYSYRFVRGGFLRQPPQNYILDLEKAEHIGPKDEKHTIDSLIIAWSAAWSSNQGGNEIAIAKDRQLLGVGGGPSTVEAVKAALARTKDCGHELSESCFAANAFFPFTDAPQFLVENNLLAGLVPLGGKNERIVKEFFRQKNLSLYFLHSDFRGFSRH